MLSSHAAPLAAPLAAQLVADDLPACPIMTDNKAVTDHYVDYDGLRYYFCCDQCVADFNSDPSRFTQLSSVRGFPIPDESAAGDEFVVVNTPWTRLQAWFRKKIYQYCLDYSLVQWHVIALIVLVVGPWLVAHWERRASRRRRDEAGEPVVETGARPGFWTRKFNRYNSRFVSRTAWVFVILLACDTAYLSSLASERHRVMSEIIANTGEGEEAITDLKMLDQLKEIHFNTLAKYGFPPRPRCCDPEHALSRSYFRGNDERHPQMFNGGQYRTVSFFVDLVDQSGQALEFGSSMQDVQPHLKVIFKRSAFTSNGYFTRDYMQRMFLTMKADRFLGRDEPVPDRLQWTEIESGRVWEALFPLPAGDRFPEQWKVAADQLPEGTHHRGIVYLCEDRFDDEELMGSRYHFAVEYDLRLEDSILLPTSNIFMGSTHEGATFQRYDIADAEWFSRDAIPEKTRL